MDSGSSRTYVTEEIVKRLKLEPTESDKLTIFTFGISKPNKNHITIIHLNHEVDMVNMVNIKANVVPKISGDMQ